MGPAHNEKSAGMQKKFRSRCSTKRQDEAAKRGSALFVVVNCSPSRQPEDQHLAPQPQIAV